MAKVKSTARKGPSTQPRKPPAPRLGSHLSIAGGVAEAIRRARELEFQTVQIFVKNQRQWVGPPLKADDIAAWKREAERDAFGPSVAHATYLINLASCDPTIREKSRGAFADELSRCDQLNIPYLVVHPGSSVGQERKAAIKGVADSINLIFERSPALRVKPLLETTAGQGSTLGSSFAELAAILAQLCQPDRVGICIDTCHVFAAGYDIRTRSGYENMVKEASGLVGLDRVRCWHLNDSRGDCGSRLDRHEHIGHGKIGNAGFKFVINDSRWTGIPMILETPKEKDEHGEEWDCVNLRTLRELTK